MTQRSSEFVVALLGLVKDSIEDYNRVKEKIFNDGTFNIDYHFPPLVEDCFDSARYILDFDLDVEKVLAEHGWDEDKIKYGGVYAAIDAVKYHKEDHVNDEDFNYNRLSDSEIQKMVGTESIQ